MFVLKLWKLFQIDTNFLNMNSRIWYMYSIFWKEINIYAVSNRLFNRITGVPVTWVCRWGDWPRTCRWTWRRGSRSGLNTVQLVYVYLVLVTTGDSAIIARNGGLNKQSEKREASTNKWISLFVIKVSENQSRCCLPSPPVTSAHVE